ncbi:transposase [Streptomyces sp. NPDC056492]|uniref:transposase n=1 Tax=unclassified Streptomyces TaxID=2593676 RepID=UPI00369CC41D
MNGRSSPSGRTAQQPCRGQGVRHRRVIDAIAFKYRTGTPWMDLPGHFGSWQGAHNRLRMWAADGTWEKVFTAQGPRPASPPTVPRTLPQHTDHQDPPRRRRQLPAPRLRPHARSGR